MEDNRCKGCGLPEDSILCVCGCVPDQQPNDVCFCSSSVCKCGNRTELPPKPNDVQKQVDELGDKLAENHKKLLQPNDVEAIGNEIVKIIVSIQTNYGMKVDSFGDLRLKEICGLVNQLQEKIAELEKRVESLHNLANFSQGKAKEHFKAKRRTEAKLKEAEKALDIYWVKQSDTEWWLMNGCNMHLATAWSNGTWHTWDLDGMGGENDVAQSLDDAKLMSVGAVIRQKFHNTIRKEQDDADKS